MFNIVLFKQLKRERRGTSIVEMIGVMLAIAVLAAITLGGISALIDNANSTSVQSDLRTYESALRQALMDNPDIMKYRADKPANSVEKVVNLINDQVESSWGFENLAGATGSGGIAGTAIKRDSWGNPYGLYIYFDDLATTYTDGAGAEYKESDSVVYLVVVSSGKGATGGAMGVDGNNYSDTTHAISDATAMVNNSDGLDDMGVIVRVVNGDIYSATFGFKSGVLGSLSKTQWIFGKPSSTGGVLYDFKTSTSKTASATVKGGSIDEYYDKQKLATAGSELIGSW